MGRTGCATALKGGSRGPHAMQEPGARRRAATPKPVPRPKPDAAKPNAHKPNAHKPNILRPNTRAAIADEAASDPTGAPRQEDRHAAKPCVNPSRIFILRPIATARMMRAIML